MEKFTINYSTKNIPLPTKKLYLKSLTDKVEKVIKRMRWKAFFYDKEKNDDKEQDEENESEKINFGFKTHKCPPQHQDLHNFENDLLEMIQNITFKPVQNQFQDQLRNDIKTINSSNKAFIPADKTRNFYEMNKESHDKLFIENITKTYKKTDQTTYERINKEAKSLAEEIGIPEKVECLAKSTAFITLKDHKENFTNNPKCRLINPAKPELGKVSKTVIEDINKTVRNQTKVNQWHNTSDVINWFENIPNKNECTFVQFDIEEFYPSISKELLLNSLTYAEQHATISEKNKKFIIHSRKSLLFANNEHWIKKTGDPNFDVTMGSFDGAELCELVGLYILHRLSEKYGIDTLGLYRDDGLCCFRNLTGPQSERTKKDLIKMFKDEFELKITIQTNLKHVDFLDVTFNLTHGTFQPYCKPNSEPMYINAHSNHPPNIIKRIPDMISDRINNISSNEAVFDRSSKLYNDALEKSGYKKKIAFNQTPKTKKRTRQRKIIWFNPPYSQNVKTNVARRFLRIVDKNFPKKHRFYKLFNRNNLKVSYSCLPNISSVISAHNKKVLSSAPPVTNACNCRNKELCPLNGKCREKQVIYQCHVKSSENDQGVYYIGLTENTFKERWYQHKTSFKYQHKANATELSKYVWGLQKNDITPNLTWEIIDRARPYVNGSKTCNLCLTEKFHIITSQKKLLNKRSELVSTCRHVNKFLLKNFKVVPPDVS